MTPDELITTAMVMSAEFHNVKPMGGRFDVWQCPGTGLYVNREDAATAFLRLRGFMIDFTGNLVKS